MVNELKDDVSNIKCMCQSLLDKVVDVEQFIDKGNATGQNRLELDNMISAIYDEYNKVNREMREVTVYYEDWFKAIGIVEDAQDIVDTSDIVNSPDKEMRDMEKDWENMEYVGENCSIVVNSCKKG